jgi:hypothetical protein
MRNGLEILRVPVEFYLFGAAKVFPVGKERNSSDF